MTNIILRRKFVQVASKDNPSTIARLLVYAGIEQPPDIWLGSRLLFALTISFLIAILPPIISQVLDMDIGFGFPGRFNLAFMFGYMILIFSICFATIIALIYLHLYYMIHDRTNRVEEVLPDFLLMVAAHMHAGLTPFAAFQSAARPEFGPLEKEVKKIVAYSMGSESFTDAIGALTRHVESPILKRTMSFFENGLRSGGKLASLIETAAEEIRDLEEIKRQTVLNTRTYTIFLVFILVGGLPILLAISTEFLSIFSSMQAQIGKDTATMVGSLMSPDLNLEPEFVDKMAVVIIVSTATLVSLFIGVISEGKVLFGLKYMPPLAILSYFFFYIVKMVLNGFLGAFF